MTEHADVVGQRRSQRRRVDYRGIMHLLVFQSNLMCQHMCETRTVTVLATNREFREERRGKMSVALRQCIWPAAVTRDAAWQNRPSEAGVCQFISRRQFPAARFGVKGQRRLKKIFTVSYQATESVLPGANDPL